MKWISEAPSNIALIKYMGKTDTARNRPTNASLSYTLPHLLSLVELELTERESEPGGDRWEPLAAYGEKSFAPLKISDKGAARFLNHLDRLKKQFKFSGKFLVRSANAFPSDCGLASSASSFAALTKVAVRALCELTNTELPGESDLAELSRLGSGSSCRSFFSPWSIWDADGARGVPDLGLGNLIHQVVIVDDKIKSVSSSEAHVRVTSSELFRGRPERADTRVSELMSALSTNAWYDAFEISWAEFWDMHALFETAKPSFGYMTPASLEALRLVRQLSWDNGVEGPLITMDAGPNVHLLYRRENESVARLVGKSLGKRFTVLSNLTSVT